MTVVKQFQKPKSSKGRQRKFKFCGQTYCFISWFRPNKAFRARIHFGSTSSIGTYSRLEDCLQAIADFTERKCNETEGRERIGWEQRNEKSQAQLARYIRTRDPDTEEEEIEKHFSLKAKEKARRTAQRVTKKEQLPPPKQEKRYQSVSPNIPPAHMKLPAKLEEELTTFKLEPINLDWFSNTVVSIEGTNIPISPVITEEDLEMQKPTHRFGRSMNENVFSPIVMQASRQNPLEDGALPTPPTDAISPMLLTMDNVLSPLSVTNQVFNWNNARLSKKRSHDFDDFDSHPAKRKLKLRKFRFRY